MLFIVNYRSYCLDSVVSSREFIVEDSCREKEKKFCYKLLSVEVATDSVTFILINATGLRLFFPRASTYLAVFAISDEREHRL